MVPPAFLDVIMTDVFRSEATTAFGSFIGYIIATVVCLVSAVLLITPLISFDYSALCGLGLLVAGVLFAIKADRNCIIVKRYIHHPPNYEEEKRHYDEEHKIL
jgi:hypothetical protein